MDHKKGFFLAFGAAASWAISILLTRFVLRGHADPAQLAFLVEIVAAPFWLIIGLRQARLVTHLSGRDVAIMAGIGAVSVMGITYLENLALQNTTASNFSFLIRSVMLFTFIFAHFFLKEKLTNKKLLLGAIIMAGSFLLITQGAALQFRLGDIFALLEAASIAFINNILLKKLVGRMHPDIVSSGTYLFGLITMAVIALPHFSLQSLPPIWLIIIISLFGQLIGLLRNRAYQYVSSSFSTTMFSFTPVIATIGAVMFLGEKIAPIQIIGGLLIISASFLAYKMKI